MSFAVGDEGDRKPDGKVSRHGPISRDTLSRTCNERLRRRAASTCRGQNVVKQTNVECVLDDELNWWRRVVRDATVVSLGWAWVLLPRSFLRYLPLRLSRHALLWSDSVLSNISELQDPEAEKRTPPERSQVRSSPPLDTPPSLPLLTQNQPSCGGETRFQRHPGLPRHLLPKGNPLNTQLGHLPSTNNDLLSSPTPFRRTFFPTGCSLFSLLNRLRH